MASRRPVLISKDVADFRGELVQLVPIGRQGVALNLLDAVADLLIEEIERALRHSAGSVLHGARMAGELGELPIGERGTWIAAGGEKGDGKNCEDCLGLHGTEMTREQYEDTKYTTACDGNCRCGFVPLAAVDDPRGIEAIAAGEFEDAQ